jgi:hypothetical protein
MGCRCRANFASLKGRKGMAEIEELAHQIADLSPEDQERLFDRAAALALQKGLRKLSDQYRDRLRREGSLDQPMEAIWEELRRIREEVAARDYPV